MNQSISDRSADAREAAREHLMEPHKTVSGLYDPLTAFLASWLIVASFIEEQDAKKARHLIEFVERELTRIYPTEGL